MKREKNRKIAFLNLLGSLGYIACLLQWFWAILILLPSIVQSPVFEFFSPDTTPTQQPVVEQPAQSSPEALPLWIGALGLLVGLFVVVGSLYVILFRFPRSVARVGEKATHSVVATVTPFVVEHIPMPPKQKRVLPEILMIVIKLLLVFVPLLLLVCARNLDLAMSFEIIVIIGVWLFSWAFLLFTLQFFLSKFLKVAYKTIR